MHPTTCVRQSNPGSRLCCQTTGLGGTQGRTQRSILGPPFIISRVMTLILATKRITAVGAFPIIVASV